MSEWKTRVTAHLRAAQGWLSKAERSFDEKKDIRAELNLMLAQAELKRAQEEKRSSKTLFRYACYRQGGAFLCAVLLFGLGSLVWIGHNADKAETVTGSSIQTTATQQAESFELQNMTPQPSIAAAEASSAPSAITAADEILPHTTKARYEEHNKTRQASPAVSLSREEMQGLVQAAGRSLRGQ